MTSSHQFFQRLIDSGPQNLPESILFGILNTVAKIYGLIIRLRLLAYRCGVVGRYKAGIPVISVGNLTVGGTGKTPVVDTLVKRLMRGGTRVAIVSRGYRGKRRAATALVSDGEGFLDDEPSRYGDEPVLLAKRLTEAVVIVARRRSEGVRLAEEMGAEVAVLDDGFQHLSLERDLDILLLDSRKPFGNRRLLPAGRLREPIRGLERADLLILTRFEGIMPEDINVSLPILTSRQVLGDRLVSLGGDTCRWQNLQGQRCVAFAGIASPQSFFDDLRQKGLTPVTEIALQDHQEFDQALLHRLAEVCRKADCCLTTEKDAVKLNRGDLPVPCWSVPLEITLHPEELIDQILQKILAERKAS